MFSAIITINGNIITIPSQALFNPKKNIDQKELRIICIPKNTNPSFLYFVCSFDFFFGCSVFHAKKSEIPIKIYSIVQTIPMKDPGGVKGGFDKLSYQELRLGVVKIEPIKPASRGKANEIISLLPIKILLFSFFFIFVC